MRLIRHILLSCILLTSCVRAIGQNPDFKFYIAFEDANGGKDTVWAIWDSTANFFPGIYDTLLGEYPDSLPEDTSFRVYLKYNVSDSGKVRAEPTTNPCSNGFNIWAVNYTYPVIVRWDTALFNQDPILFNPHRATLSNDYFFLYWNDPNFINEYNMLIIDSVELQPFTFGSQDHFPMSFQMESFVVGVSEFFLEKNLRVFPNPSQGTINVEQDRNIEEIELYNLLGELIYSTKVLSGKISINLELKSAVYLMKIKTEHAIINRKLIIQR